MRRISLRKMAVVVLVALVAVLPVLAGCAGGDEDENTVILGWLGDETGVSAAAFKEVRYGLLDYLATMEKTNPIPGVKIEVLTYDTRLESGRVPTGYQWLKGQGMDVLIQWSPGAYAMTLENQKNDSIASFCTTAYPATQDSGWVYSWGPSEFDQGQWLAQALVDDWDETTEGRTIKVGYVDVAGYSSANFCREGIEAWIAQNAGAMDYKVVQGGSSQTAWASEIDALKDRDVIVFATPATAGASFLNEVRARGYTGRLQATAFSFLSYLTLIKNSVGAAGLDGIRIPHAYTLFTEGSDFALQAKEALYELRPAEADTLKGGTTWISGWIYGFILSEAIRHAADTAGSENVNAEAIHEALDSLEIEIPGASVTATVTGEKDVLFPYYRMVEYDGELDDVVPVGDYVIVPGWAS